MVFDWNQHIRSDKPLEWKAFQKSIQRSFLVVRATLETAIIAAEWKGWYVRFGALECLYIGSALKCSSVQTFWGNRPVTWKSSGVKKRMRPRGLLPSSICCASCSSTLEYLITLTPAQITIHLDCCSIFKWTAFEDPRKLQLIQNEMVHTLSCLALGALLMWCQFCRCGAGCH